MHLLDNPKTYERYDRANMRASIAALAEQCHEAWEETNALPIPRSYRHTIDQVVIAGMGGSALGPHIIASTMAEDILVPLTVVRSYTLPQSVTRRSIVIASSYSGSTEETIAAAKEALARKARVIGITTGGPLAALLSRHGAPTYRFNPRHNPCGQPRMGLGYMLFGHLGLLSRLGVCRISKCMVDDVIRWSRVVVRAYAPAVPTEKNRAKQLAEFLHQSIPIFFGPDIIEGPLHTFANQMNENAKIFSAFFTLPELNHHLVEGFPFPKASRRLLRFVLFTTPHAHPRVQKRVRITAEVLKKNGFTFWEEALRGVTPFAAAMTLLVFGSYASFYTALLERRDPSPIPWVDYLKKKLA